LSEDLRQAIENTEIKSYRMQRAETLALRVASAAWGLSENEMIAVGINLALDMCVRNLGDQTLCDFLNALDLENLNRIREDRGFRPVSKTHKRFSLQ
jgi:hypothetical protein